MTLIFILIALTPFPAAFAVVWFLKIITGRKSVDLFRPDDYIIGADPYLDGAITLTKINNGRAFIIDFDF